jgi:pyruvate ferredoxin oxidoreductase gamma subunit
MKEIRWHARAGQGAKTASHLLAVALLETGRYVQAFPEYGPERRGAPIRAFNRIDDRPIRRHDTVTAPDVVVVLDTSLLADPAVKEGLGADGVLLVSSDRPREGALAIPTAGLAPGSANLVMLGALAAVLGEPPLVALADAATDLLGAKVDPEAIRTALSAGFAHVGEEASCAA